MKNLFLLQTEKPSRLHYYFIGNYYALSKEPLNWRNASHVYITSNEEIKEGDWYINLLDNKIWKAEPNFINTNGIIGSKLKKIILTTDAQLIKDGVQAIDDTFLEWFVQNPSCEEVGIKVEFMQTPDYLKDGFYYKIIIPQEEPKQEIELIDGFIPTSFFDKQETLEEALKNELEFVHNSCRNFDFDLGFKTGGLIGANWQSKQLLSLDKEGLIKTDNDKLLYQIGVAKGMVQGIESQQKKSYSQEEAGELVYNMIGEYAKHYGVMIDGAKLNELFEQFKKK
jgi:hypothetical protein